MVLRLFGYTVRVYRFLCLSGIIGLVFITAHAQESWPSPEVQQMYEQAHNYLTAGSFQQAIITYQQAIQLAPDKMILYRDLGKAYYLTGNYDQAEKTLEPVLETSQADAQTYQVMAQCYNASGEKKKAKNTLEKGINLFPNAGILYHDMGKMFTDDNQQVYALETWLDGIQHDPAYHVNYYEAARTYMNTNKPVWAILYGEMFVNIEHHTPRADEVRGMLLDAYKQLFNNMPAGDIPKFGQVKKADKPVSFEDAVRLTYIKLSPVISDGITAESLTMLRARFLMEWDAHYAAQFPVTLFSYQDEMLREGYFDIYNEWLFGKASNAPEYESWNKFHTGVIPQFEAWMGMHPFHPAVSDFYNDKQVDNIFKKN